MRARFPSLHQPRVAVPASIVESVLAFFGTALVFWTPFLLIHVIFRQNFGSLAVLLVTFLLPAITCLAFSWALRQYPIRRPVAHSLVGVLGIWVTGPTSMLLAATLHGAGFAGLEFLPGLGLAAYLTLLFPVGTVSLGAYSGSLGAVLITTVALPVTTWLLRRVDRRRS